MKGGEHRQVVQVVACCENLVAMETEAARYFGQGGAFIESLVAEPRIDIVSDDVEVWNAAAIIGQVRVNKVGIAVVSGDQTEGGVGVFINAGVETSVDPGHQAREIGLDAGE